MHTLLQTLQVYKFKKKCKQEKREVHVTEGSTTRTAEHAGAARGKQSLIFYSAACKKFGPDSGGFKNQLL